MQWNVKLWSSYMNSMVSQTILNNLLINHVFQPHAENWRECLVGRSYRKIIVHCDLQIVKYVLQESSTALDFTQYLPTTMLPDIICTEISNKPFCPLIWKSLTDVTVLSLTWNVYDVTCGINKLFWELV